MQAPHYHQKWLSAEELVRFKPQSRDNLLLKALETRRQRRRCA